MWLKGYRKWLIALLSVIALAGAYAAAGFFGVPWLLRSQLQAFCMKHYARQASIGEIRFNPFTLVLDAHDFSLPDQDGQVLLGVGRLRVDADIASVWRAAPSFTSMEIGQPVVRAVVRPNGTLNLAELAKPFESNDPEPTRLFIDRLRVTAGAMGFEDRTRPSRFHTRLQPIDFELRDFSTTSRGGNAYSLRAAGEAAERIAWDGTFSLEPLGSRGRFEIAGLQAKTVWSYFRDALDFEVSGGTVGISGEFDFQAARKTQLRANIHSVVATDLGLRPKADAGDYIELAKVEVNETKLDLLRERVDIGKILLAGGKVRAWRDEQGRINLAALVAADSPTPAAPAPSPATDAAQAPEPASAGAPGWVVSAPDIETRDLRIEIEDRMMKPTAAFVLSPVNLRVQKFSTAAGGEIEVDGDIGVGEKGRVKAHSQFVPDTSALSAHVEVAALDLVSLQPYVSTYTQATLMGGALQAALDVKRTANGAISVKGNTEVADFRAIDNALRQDLIRWKRLRLQGVDYSSERGSLRIAAIDARSPYARLIIAQDQTLNITRVMTSAASDSSAPAPRPAATAKADTRARSTDKPLRMRIDAVRISEASANFADFWIQPNYAVSLQGMNGTISGLSSDPQSRARIDLEGKVDRYAPAKIGGEINLLSASLFTDVKVSFKGVEMTSATPYSGRFAGYKIEKGKLSIDVAYRVENRQLNAEQHFVIDQLQLGERVESPDAVRLPVRLAVALLKDRNGVIDIDLPMTGNLDDPQFRLGPLIWKAIVGLLTKVATAPFALLGKMFGNGEEINQIDFAPGDATLDAAAQERMNALAKALKERSQLQLEVPVVYSPELDAPALANVQLDETLTALAETRPAKRKDETPPLEDPARRFDLLVTQYKNVFGSKAELPPVATDTLNARKKKKETPDFEAANTELTNAITAKQPVTQPALEQLAQARARAIQDALLGSGEVDASRVFLLAASEVKPAESKVRVALTLK